MLEFQRGNLPVHQRLTSELGYKVLISFALSALAYLPYFLSQALALAEAVRIPSTALDELIPFMPMTTWVYLSLFFLMPIAPALMVRRRSLHQYTVSVLITVVVANGLFFAIPTYVEQPESEAMLFAALKSVDGVRNAAPSLHAAMALLSMLAFEWAQPRPGRPAVWRCLIWVWGSAIIVTTLTTKQHRLLDVMAGSALAVMAWGAVNAASYYTVTRQRAPTSA